MSSGALSLAGGALCSVETVGACSRTSTCSRITTSDGKIIWMKGGGVSVTSRVRLKGSWLGAAQRSEYSPGCKPRNSNCPLWSVLEVRPSAGRRRPVSVHTASAMGRFLSSRTSPCTASVVGRARGKQKLARRSAVPGMRLPVTHRSRWISMLVLTSKSLRARATIHLPSWNSVSSCVLSDFPQQRGSGSSVGWSLDRSSALSEQGRTD